MNVPHGVGLCRDLIKHLVEKRPIGRREHGDQASQLEINVRLVRGKEFPYPDAGWIELALVCRQVEPARITLEYGGDGMTGTAVPQCNLHHAVALRAAGCSSRPSRRCQLPYRMREDSNGWSTRIARM